jgi:broad specificity phosphatase PhoE
MTFVYLVRHGQTAWNKSEIFRGRADVPLNEIGLKEAELAAEYFRGKKVDAVYASPISRAIQTAEKIAGVLGLKVLLHPGITDMSFGDWEGRPINEVESNDADRFRLWQEGPHLLKVPGGETLEEVRTRSMAALEEVIQTHAHGTVIMVSHRVVTKVLICAILGLDNSHFWQIDQDATAINLVRYRNGTYALSLMNETCHLKPLTDRGMK